MSHALCAPTTPLLPTLHLPSLRLILAAASLLAQSATMAALLWLVLAVPGFIAPQHHTPAHTAALR